MNMTKKVTPLGLALLTVLIGSTQAQTADRIVARTPQEAEPKSTREIRLPILNPTMPKTAVGPSIFARAASTSCVPDAIACAKETGGFVEDCSEDTADDGFSTLQCLSSMYNFGSTCITAAESCSNGAQEKFNNPVSTVGWGGSTGALYKMECKTDLNIDRIRMYFANYGGVQFMTKIEITCSNLETFTVGYNNGESTVTSECDTGEMMSGIVPYTDINNRNGYNYVNGMMVYCQNLSTATARATARVGDSNHGYGVPLSCGANQHMHGINVRRDSSGYTYTQKIRSLQAICN